MKKPLLEMLKLLLCDFVACVIAYLLLNFSFAFSVQIFGYAACLIIMPYVFRRADTELKVKLCISAVILTVSFAATVYAEGVGRTLFRNSVVFALVLIICIAEQLRKRPKS